MNLDRAARYYCELSAEERFRLVTLACARHDTEEEDRLTDSCPRRVYEMNDMAFSRRWSAANSVADVFVVEVERFFAWLEMLDMLREPVARLTDLLVTGSPWPEEEEPADGDGDTREALPVEKDARPAWERLPWETDRYPAMAMEVFHRATVAHITARWQAFGEVCRTEIGLEPEEVLEAYWPGRLAGIQALAAEMPQELTECEASTRDYWRERTGELWRVSLGAG